MALEVIDLAGTQPESSDLEGLRAYLRQLVGQPFLHFRFSYGDELTLHFGQPRNYRSAKLKHLPKGSYIVGARASSWEIVSPPVVIFPSREGGAPSRSRRKPITPQELEAASFVQRGARVLFAEPWGLPSSLGVVLALSDGSSLVIDPASAEKPTPKGDIADWEVFTPYDRCLRVGPGMRWSYLPSRIPPKS